MKRSSSSHSHRDEKSRSTRGEDHDSSRSRYEEKLRRRREWLIQQEREREHERLKKKMIMEYEKRREQTLKVAKGRSPHRSRSKSRSRSLDSHHRRPLSVPKSTVMSEKLESTGGTTLFKGPEGTQISATELRRIKVDIHRNIPPKEITTELQRDIINPEDVVLKRRKGEGSKPIFEREEIKGTLFKTEEIEEHRTVVSLDNESSVSRTYTAKRRSASLGSRRNRSRSCSPQPTSSRHSSFTNASDGLRKNRLRCDKDAEFAFYLIICTCLITLMLFAFLFSCLQSV